MKEGVGGGDGRKLVSFFFSPPLPALSLAPFFARSSFFAPKALVNACYAGHMWGKRTTIFQGSKNAHSAILDMLFMPI